MGLETTLKIKIGNFSMLSTGLRHVAIHERPPFVNGQNIRYGAVLAVSFDVARVIRPHFPRYSRDGARA
jgi:hypothetical protein